MTDDKRKNINIHAIIQARMGSTRLPGKVLMRIAGKSILEHVVDRCRRSRLLTNVIVATTVSEKDDPVYQLCQSRGIPVYRGSEDDVLARFYETALEYDSDLIVRVTADCPLIDPVIIDSMVNDCLTKDIKFYENYYYSSNTTQTKKGFPDGTNIQVFWIDKLLEAYEYSSTDNEREHVTPYIRRLYKEMYRIPDLDNYNLDLGTLELSVDTKEDFELVSGVIEHLYPENPGYSIHDVLGYLEEKKSSEK